MTPRRGDQSLTKGRRATSRARLTAADSLRWCLKHVPVILLFRIFPRSEMKSRRR